MRLVLIPAGKFTMGSPGKEKGRRKDEAQREVEIAKAFYLGAHEVKQGEFEQVMGFNPSYFSASALGRKGASYLDWSKPGGGKSKVKDLGSTRDFPVENVSWDEAVEFCAKLSALPAERKAGRAYRLPSEAEWEYACRGGARSYQVFHFGDSLSSQQANFRGNEPYGTAGKGAWLERTCKVGSYKPNAFGLHDMHGNVWEWCSDRYAKGDDARVRRGGCWIVAGNECRSAVRRRRVPDDRRFNLGFRVVLEEGRPTREGRAAPAGGPSKEWAVLKERVRAQWRRPGAYRIRFTGKVTVIDGNTLRFGDGTRVVTAGGMDAPDLEQRALIGDKLYPCGKDAADFLKKLIGDRPVSFYAFESANDRDASKRIRGACFVGDTNLGAEMVRAGWALAHHSGMTPYEIVARENKRGLWRGRFVLPERWRKGQRLPGEPPEIEPERQAFAALGKFVPAVKIDQPGNRVVAIELTANKRKLTDDDLRQLRKFVKLRSVDLHGTAITDAGLDHLAALADLAELGLDWTKVTPARVVRLVKDRSKFQALSLSGVHFGDSDLGELKGLTGLGLLGLRGSSVTDKGLVHLKPFTKLRVLSLMSTGIGDAGLEHLKGLTGLEDLDLDRTAITDAGLVHLKPLVKLRRLQMAHTAITDAGLEHLQALSNLQELNLRGTRVTEKGVERLKQRLPQLRAGYGPAPR
jgi:formylglycine-generating enzyme required for sulfatase activity/endonuclease YncB( thermonuclease family)